MSAVPNIGLQRTAPCGLAAEAGAFGTRGRSILVAKRALCSLFMVSVVAADDTSAREARMHQYEAAHPDVLRVGGVVVPPRQVHRVEPNFAAIPKDKRVFGGPIIVEAVISAKGQVVDPVVVSERQPALDAIVLDAVRQWKYEPAKNRDRPVAVFLVITVNF